MSVYPKEAVKEAGEACGITSLADDVAQAIASDLEYRLRGIVQVFRVFVFYLKSPAYAMDSW